MCNDEKGPPEAEGSVAAEARDEVMPGMFLTTGRMELAVRVSRASSHLSSLAEVLRGQGDCCPGAFSDLKEVTLAYLRDLASQIEAQH